MRVAGLNYGCLGAVAGLLVFPLCSPVQSAVILTDHFDNAFMDNGVLRSVVDYGPATATSNHGLSVGTLDNSAMFLGGGSGSIYITAALPQAVSLADVGDFVQMTFDFTTVGNTRGNRVLRYGFFQGAPDDTDAAGYFAAGANQGAGTGNDDMNSMLAVADGSSDFFTVDRPSDRTESGNRNVLLPEPAKATLRVERISATQIQLTATHGTHVLSPHIHSISDSSAVIIDEIWFGIRDRSTTFTIDSLEITYIPEPASLALMGLGGLIILKRRKM